MHDNTVNNLYAIKLTAEFTGISAATIWFYPKPIQLLKIFEYLFKHNIYTEETVFQ